VGKWKNALPERKIYGAFNRMTSTSAPFCTAALLVSSTFCVVASEQLKMLFQIKLIRSVF